MEDVVIQKVPTLVPLSSIVNIEAWNDKDPYTILYRPDVTQTLIKLSPIYYLFTQTS